MYIGTVNAIITIATSTTISNGVFMQGGIAGAILMPAALTGTALSFQVSIDDTVYTALYDTTGSAVSYTVAASRIIPLNKEVFASFPYLKIVSGSAEGANRTFTIFIRAG